MDDQEFLKRMEKAIIFIMSNEPVKDEIPLSEFRHLWLRNVDKLNLPPRMKNDASTFYKLYHTDIFLKVLAESVEEASEPKKRKKSHLTLVKG